MTLFLALYNVDEVFGKGYLFWQTLSFSVFGSVFMMYAMGFRIYLIQCDVKRNILSADFIANLVLLIIVPVMFYLLGEAAMIFLYLLSSISAYIVYYCFFNFFRTSHDF